MPTLDCIYTDLLLFLHAGARICQFIGPGDSLWGCLEHSETQTNLESFIQLLNSYVPIQPTTELEDSSSVS